MSVLRGHLEKATAQDAARGRGKPARGGPRAGLREASDALQPEDDSRRRLLDAFVAELPELLQQGACVETALRLPMRDAGAERAVKRLVLALSRHLESADYPDLAPSDLAQLPLLLQRLQLQDHALFDGFCAACGRSWSKFTKEQLSLLLRSTEDYGLLHPTGGPALARLVAALRGDLAGSGEAPRPSDLDALTRAALDVRASGLRAPLLESLRAKVEALDVASLTDLSAAAPALHAAAELGASAGLSPATLEPLLEAARAALGRSAGDDDALDEHGASIVRACSRAYRSAPSATEALLDALLERLGTGGLASLLDAPAARHSLAAGRGVPGALRLRLAERAAPGGASKEAVPGLRPEAATIWLGLLHDLPSIAPSTARSAELSVVVAALVERILAASQDAPPPPSALCLAFLAASGLRSEGAADLAERALQALDGQWSRLRASDVQVLFRTTGDAKEVARRAYANFGQLADVRTMLAVLKADVGEGGSSAPPAAKERLLKSIALVSSSKELSAAEAALRQWPAGLGEEAEALRRELLTAARARLFEARVSAPLAGGKRPPRGFLLYVQACAERARAALQACIEAPSREAAAAASEALTAPAAAVPVAPVMKESNDEPDSGARGVAWHRGVGGWEVKVEVQGRKVLGGYFKPLDKSTEEVERARVAALECHRSLEFKHYHRISA